MTIVVNGSPVEIPNTQLMNVGIFEMMGDGYNTVQKTWNKIYSQNLINLYEDKVSKSDVIDSLTSTSATAPLSANQGKVLQDTKANVVHQHNIMDINGNINADRVNESADRKFVTQLMFDALAAGSLGTGSSEAAINTIRDGVDNTWNTLKKIFNIVSPVLMDAPEAGNTLLKLYNLITQQSLAITNIIDNAPSNANTLRLLKNLIDSNQSALIGTASFNYNTLGKIEYAMTQIVEDLAGGDTLASDFSGNSVDLKSFADVKTFLKALISSIDPETFYATYNITSTDYDDNNRPIQINYANGDVVSISYVTSGNGIGEIAKKEYSTAGVIYHRISYTYDANHRFYSQTVEYL